ncbi:MAG: hypothetical protein M3P32_01840 [Chloroflexota bacterium]|nr:hypothetical protein [Chloroflexota bacterium]
MSPFARRAIIAVLITYLGLAGYILGRFANDAMPTYYLYRPLAVVVPLAIVIGLLAAWRFPVHSPIAAGAAVAAVTFWATWMRHVPEIMAAGAVLLALFLVAWWRWRRIPSLPRSFSTAVTVFVAIFFVSGLVRAALTFEGPIPEVAAIGTATGPNIYLVLLDAYPRRDTLLDDMGIDNGPFEEALEGRGFDLYDDARTDRRYTDFTLMGLLYGEADAAPPDSDLNFSGQWKLRKDLSLAPLPIAAQEAGYEYVVVDSPVGHVTFEAGRHIQHGGFNTLEDFMVAESVFGPIVKAWFPYLPTDSLRDHFEASVQSLEDLVDPSAHRLVLTHLFQPHLPFLWDADGNPQPAPFFWPRSKLLTGQIEVMGIGVEQYAASMEANLATLNRKLLAMVDEIVTNDPGAVVVLFSDHGSRYSLALQETEWYRSFLATRTPGHPGLFANDPTPTALLRTLIPIYVTGSAAP